MIYIFSIQSFNPSYSGYRPGSIYPPTVGSKRCNVSILLILDIGLEGSIERRRSWQSSIVSILLILDIGLEDFTPNEVMELLTSFQSFLFWI